MNIKRHASPSNDIYIFRQMIAMRIGIPPQNFVFEDIFIIIWAKLRVDLYTRYEFDTQKTTEKYF